MSIENVERFLEALTRDEALKARAAELTRKNEGRKLNREEREAFLSDELVPFAEKEGFSFTVEELNRHSVTLADQKGRLSEDELESVVGSGGCTCIIGGGGPGGQCDRTCWCVFYGFGYDIFGEERCACFAAGGGHTYKSCPSGGKGM